MKPFLILFLTLFSTSAFSQTRPLTTKDTTKPKGVVATTTDRVRDSLLLRDMILSATSPAALRTSLETLSGTNRLNAFAIQGLPAATDLSNYVQKSANLSDLVNINTARQNLGLGTLATQSGTFSGTASGTNTGDETASRINALYGYIPASSSVVASQGASISTLSNSLASLSANFDAATAVMNSKASVVLNQITTASVTGTTEGSLKGGITGTDTLKASEFKVGKVWAGFMDGSYNTPIVTVGSITVKVYLGNTVILAQTIGNLPVNVTGYPFTAKITIVCRQTGSNGQVAASGYVEFNTGTTFTALKPFFSPTVTNIDLTTNKVYNATVTYSTTGNSISSFTHTLISLN